MQKKKKKKKKKKVFFWSTLDPDFKCTFYFFGQQIFLLVVVGQQILNVL